MKGTVRTVDERTCLGVCTTNIIPGKPGAPDPPIESALGQPSYGPGVVVEEGLSEEDGLPRLKVSNIKNTGIKLKCESKGGDKSLFGPTGKEVRVECPRKCADATVEGVVIGT